MKRKCSLILLFCSICIFAQKKDSLVFKNGIDKPSMLPIHHFGIFSARINQNFKKHPVKNTKLQFTFASANIFHPFVELFLPEDEAIRNKFKETIWFNRHFFIDQETTPATYENITIDGVFKNLRVDYMKKINSKHELQLTLRSYLITTGKYPFSTITSDEFIEWFHSNIAGGEDPFGRKYYGINQVNIKYQDRNGTSLSLREGQFFVAGLEINHFYYPSISSLKEKNIALNFGTHFGINTTKYNPSIDLGLSGNILKEWFFNNNNQFRAGLGLAVLRKNTINFDNIVNLGNNRFLGSLEAMIEFTKYSSKKNYHSFGVNYQVQSSFHKRDEANYYQLVGLWKEIHSGWQNGFQKLYEYQSAWSFLYTYGHKKYKLLIYAKQDLYLNNSPDIQTGFSLNIPIFNN